MTRFDFKNEVLRSKTIWLCASCYACTVECPRQIRITDIIYELKQRAIKEGLYPSRFPIPVLAKEFTKMVHDYGRVNETLLATKMFMKTNPLAALGMSKLGLGLIRTGRFSMRQDKIENRADLARMMETLDQGNEKATT
jgi:heterodisulfide reductase subunit C